MSKNNHKNVTVERATFTKAEREYVKGMVRNLSFQRLTDREMVQWLHDEKQIDLDRSTISKMRLQVEKEATKWYIGIRESGSKYVAIYKERLDSLLCYQKRLNEIVDSYLPERIYPEIVIRAISELHRIEMSLHTLMKELPGDIKTSEDFDEKDKVKEKNGFLTFDEWVSESNNLRPRIGDDSCYSDEENGQYYWGLHKKYKEYVRDWENKNFGPDLDEAWGTEAYPPKEIVRVPSETIIQIPPVDSDSTVAEPTETIQDLEAANNRNRRAKSRSSNQE